MSETCIGKTKNGRACRRKTKQIYCHHHIPMEIDSVLYEDDFQEDDLETDVKLQDRLVKEPLRCSICYEDMKEKEKTKLPNCVHTEFHKSCLQKCFKRECPLCRAPHDIKIKGMTPTPSSDIPQEILDEMMEELREMAEIHGMSIPVLVNRLPIDRAQQYIVAINMIGQM